MLRNVLYAGYIEMVNKKAERKKHKKKALTRNIPLRQARHKAIISYNTWLKIQDLLTGRNRGKAKTMVN